MKNGKISDSLKKYFGFLILKDIRRKLFLRSWRVEMFSF